MKSHAIQDRLCLAVKKRVMGRMWRDEAERVKVGETFSLAWEPVLWAERPASLHSETTSRACNFHPAPQPHKRLLRAAGWALVKHLVLL